ncbi:MAG: peptidylprolyl isomerase [Acidobacteria bacterium]|nr:peptidylprolyl isomerase [Acidobacteriota bacterium]
MTVSTGKEVSIEYTLKLADQSVVDTNVGAEPLTYTHGTKQIIPGLEKALEGMAVGESKQVEVAPEESYGVPDASAYREVRKDHVPPEAMHVGAQLQGRSQSGDVVQARVAMLKEETVILDFNHPLAGKTLYVDVKVLNVQQAPAK